MKINCGKTYNALNYRNQATFQQFETVKERASLGNGKEI